MVGFGSGMDSRLRGNDSEVGGNDSEVLEMTVKY